MGLHRALWRPQNLAEHDRVPGGVVDGETQEEAGVQITAEQLCSLSHWTTPEGAKRRYSTWFFLAVLAADQEVRVDGGEISAYRWVRPADAFADSYSANASNTLAMARGSSAPTS